jgi:hypothetical protein
LPQAERARRTTMRPTARRMAMLMGNLCKRV